ncbi:MAG TPA: hypothetical protein VN426_07630, partial [Syntrophomonadaceae bacterium]|nr:hypothetical protein [Syntrophomonadaceae bacterium]
MSALASYGKFLVKIGLLTSNPVLMLRRAVKKSCSKRNQSDLNYQKLTRFLRAKTFTPNALRNLLIVTLQYQMDLTAVEMSQLLLDDVVWSRKLPKGLLVGQGAARRFILLKNKLLIKALNLYIIIRKLQIGTRLIKGRSGQEQGLSPTSIHRVVKTAWQQVGLGAFRPWSSQPVIDDNIGGRQTRLDRSIPDHNAA